MNKKIISLCMILFILIICTTVNAKDITNSTNTTITSNKIDNSNIEQIEPTIKKDTNKNTNITKNTSNKQEQLIQSTTDKKNIIKLSSKEKKLNIKTDTIQEVTNLNITGIVTTAYDKENNTYAADEEEGYTVQGAKITLYDNTGKVLKTTLSDTEGKYQFTNLTNGTYTVEFKYGTYEVTKEQINLRTRSLKANHIFVPDILIIAFSGDNNGNGQAEKIKYLKQMSDRILFLESYELNNSYDKSGQWMINFANFILVDMYSIGNGFGIDVDLVADSPASHNNKIAYCFGLFDDSILQGTLGRWGWLGTNPHSVQNTYVGSYWQALSETNSTTIKTNMKNLLEYIRYLLGETKVDPTQNGRGPLLLSNSWGLYYPGYTGNVKLPSSNLIKTWIETNPGYNADGAGSLNWMIENYSQWNIENNNPAKILRNFEDWYTANKKLKSSFIIISTYYEGGAVVDALIKEYEKQGRAVFSLYKTTSEDPDMTALLEMAGNKSVLKRGVSAVSYMYWWTTGYAQRGGNYTINAYKNLNVSLIDALKDISKFSYESEYGPQNEWTAAVTMPELEGVFGAIPVSYVNDNKETVIIPEGVAKHVQITNGWAKLRDLNNSDKKISILVYGYPPGKANIGASYLDVFQSIHDLLGKLYDEGYNIGMNKSEIPTTDEINAIISDFGNKGLWAEGLLDEYVIKNYDELTNNGQLVAKATYNKWYKALPKQLQQDLTDYWGAQLGNGSMIYREKVAVNIKDLKSWLNNLTGNYKDQFEHYWDINTRKIVISKNSKTMVLNKTNFYLWLYDLPANLQKVFSKHGGSGLLNETLYKNQGYFLIPGKRFGNIFLSVQPVRGWESQIDFHNSYLPPPQQYVAYYKYLSQIFKTNAIIHMGTHGTLEWLPGRNLGLQSSDWPFQLIDTPIIYPYIVSNPGEGMVAKERSFAQVITHITPITSVSSLYGDYAELKDAISKYDSNKNTGVTENLEYYKEYILNITQSLGYDEPDYVTVQKYVDDYLIAVNNNNNKSISKARSALIQKAAILNFNKPAAGKFDAWLKKLQKYLSSEEAFEEWLAIIHANLEALETDKINSGMHTLGRIWNDSEMITGVSSIVSSRTDVLNDIMNILYPEITQSYYDKIKQRSFNSQKEIIQGVLTSMVTNIVEGESVKSVAESYGVFNESAPLYEDLLFIEETINDILNNHEWESILSALSGGYVEPALSADPLYSDVLPTGGAMYTSDSTKIPSKSAWQSAKNSIDQVLIKYMVDLGEESYPELVGEVIWGTEILRTEGISIAQFLYLLGVQPTWDKTGTVTGIEVIPLENLTLTIDGTVYNRPRIDVFATMVCNNPDWISLLTDSVSLVNSLKESVKDNYVKKHYKESGSLERLFGLPGAILEGTGVADLLNNAGTKLSEADGISTELASVYESRIGHSWNVDDSGNIVVKDDGKSFSYLLEHMDLIIQDLDSTWRYLDSDDYLDWFGGLLNAANVHGNIVNTVLLDIRDKNNVVTSTLGEEVKKETRTTILNPQWLNDITTEVGGWNQMSMNFENLMKTMLTTQEYKENQAGKAVLDTSTGNNAGIIGDGLLGELAELVTYSDYFTIDAQYKSYAFQSMAGWLLTSDMAGFWKTENVALRKDMLQKYVDNANRYGVACCHHTCGNINFHEWIIKTGSSLGVKGLSEYSEIYASATKNPDAIYADPSNPDATISTDGSANGVVDVSEGISEYLNDGATSEANAMAMASAGATGLADTSNNNGNSMTMAKVNNGGKGSGNSGNSQGSSDVGTNTGTGNGTDNAAEGGGSGNGEGSGNGQPVQDATTDANSQVSQNGTDTSSDAGDNSESESQTATEVTVNDVSSDQGSSAGGESGDSAGAASVYELVKKSVGKPPSPQSEIAFGYLMFIVVILVIFFVGFTKPNIKR